MTFQVQHPIVSLLLHEKWTGELPDHNFSLEEAYYQLIDLGHLLIQGGELFCRGHLDVYVQMWGMHSKHAITWEETNRLLQINYTSNDSNRTMCVVQDELIESSRTMFVRMNELLSDETPSQPTMIAGITMIDQLIEDSFFLPGEPLPEQDLPSIIVDQRDASHAMSGRTIFDLDAKVDAILASYSR